MFGFYCINKPAGPTSHDIVAKMRRVLPRKTRVGHAGTLDPFATGVLVVCVGSATRLADYVQNAPKRYLAGVALGATANTCDVTGEITPFENAAPPPRREDIEKLLAERFTGKISQTPPAHSAIHIDGVRAYELARAGKEFDIPSRTVEIYDIAVVSYDYPRLTIDIRCSCGTYIRSLARDIGESLNTGAYCETLCRTEVGGFTISAAKPVEQIDLSADLIEPAAVLDMEKIAIPDALLDDLYNGKTLPAAGPLESAEYALTDSSGRLIAIAVPTDDRRLQPKKVFH